MFVWTDLETTGLEPTENRILALGILITDDAFREVARAEWPVYADPSCPEVRAMSDFVREMHTRGGTLERSFASPWGLGSVEQHACALIDAHAGAPAVEIRTRPCMAGNSVAFDRAFIALHMPELARRYNYRLLDVSTLKVLAMATVPGAREWNDSRPPAPHTPLADLEGSIAELEHWRQALRSQTETTNTRGAP